MIEIKDLGFGVIEIFDKDTQYAPAQSIKIGNNTYIREDLINKQIADLQHRLEVANKMGRDAEKENQQLKQQLTESKKQCQECKHLNKKIELNIKNKLMTENCELQKQLTKKEKEIEKYRDANIIVVGGRSQGKKHLMEIKIKELQNQKALEQLEKVKDIILNERKITSFNFDIFNKGKDTALFWLNEQIDNQIEELKKEMK